MVSVLHCGLLYSLHELLMVACLELSQLAGTGLCGETCETSAGV